MYPANAFLLSFHWRKHCGTHSGSTWTLVRRKQARPKVSWFAQGYSQGFFVLPLTCTTPTHKEKLMPLSSGSFVFLPLPPSALSLLYKSTCGILSFRLRCSDAGVNTGLITTQKYYSLPEEEFIAKIIGFVFVYVTTLQ